MSPGMGTMTNRCTKQKLDKVSLQQRKIFNKSKSCNKQLRLFISFKNLIIPLIHSFQSPIDHSYGIQPAQQNSSLMLKFQNICSTKCKFNINSNFYKPQNVFLGQYQRNWNSPRYEKRPHKCSKIVLRGERYLQK